jgi:hypothetical protein
LETGDFKIFQIIFLMLVDYLRLLRPKHWIKNLLIFLPLIFSLNVLNQKLYLTASLIFFAFCLASSAVYIFNDFFDRKHDVIKNRPLVHNELNIKFIFAISIFFVVCALIIAFWQDVVLGVIILTYLIFNIFYTLIFKNFFLIDVSFIAFGFVFRILAGAVAIKEEISIWIILIIFFTAILIALSKRKMETEQYIFFRSPKYRQKILDYLIIVVFLLIVILYFCWSINPLIALKFQTKSLFLTVPFVLIGLFRFLQNVYYKKKYTDPVEIIYKDGILLSIFLGWLIITTIIIYV